MFIIETVMAPLSTVGIIIIIRHVHIAVSLLFVMYIVGTKIIRAKVVISLKADKLCEQQYQLMKEYNTIYQSPFEGESVGYHEMLDFSCNVFSYYVKAIARPETMHNYVFNPSILDQNN